MEMTVHLNSGELIPVQVKPCPFCGSTPNITHQGNGYTKSQALHTKCPKCRFGRTDRVIRQPITWLLGKTVEAWNTRATPNELEGE